jgi:hypothetical protein
MVANSGTKMWYTLNQTIQGISINTFDVFKSI